MGRAFIILITTILFPLATMSQAGMWTWVKGSNSGSPPAVYGTQGIEAAANTPRGFYEAAEWTDLQGNFWLFGGLSSGEFSDLWKYNPTTNNWTWVKGPGINGSAGSYGTIGVP